MQETDQQPEIEIKREWYYTDAKLKALRDVIREKYIGSFTIPPLGSGLGGLNWSEVCPRIAEALRGLMTCVSWSSSPAERRRPVRCQNNDQRRK